MEAVANGAEFRIQTDQDPPNNGSCAVSSSSASAVFRKIEFHPARRPFNGFSNGGSDFKIETLNPSSGNKQSLSAPSVKKPDVSDLFDHGLDPEFSFSISFRKIGAGLENLGNTCFLNSVLQCLTYTEPLAAYLQSAAHQKYCHVAGFCALCAMQKHVRTARQATGRILAPKDLVSNLRCISRNFRNCRQEDAHEYMINLLECMHKCCLPSGVPSESSDAYRSSLVHKIFGGSLRSQVKCKQCSHCSNKFDPFLDLSLDISRADSLHKALSRFTAVEVLDDGAKVYQCEKCKKKVNADKQLTVSKAPYILAVHLKRFEAHRSEKIDKKVQFPPAIDMKPFVSGSNEGNLKYTLYGVLVHYGRSIHSGHYACFIRTSSGMWYSLDDNRVVQVSERTVFDQKAYMLFYVRDRQNTAPKNAVPVVRKETFKESLAPNRASATLSSNTKDQVNGSVVIKESILDAPAANTQKNPPNIAEAKEILKKENSSVPLKSCDPVATAVLTQKDVIAEETLVIEVPIPQTNGNGSVVKDDSKVTCVILPGTVSAPQDGSTNNQIQVNLATSGAKAENSVDEKNSVNNLNESANSLEVKNVLNGNLLVEEAVHNDHTLGQRSEESATTSESIKKTSDSTTLAPPRKTRKRNRKTLQMGLTFFKMSLGLRKIKKQKKTRLSASAVKIISEELISNKGAIDHQHSTSQVTSGVPSGSTCLQEKETSVNTHSKRSSNSNGNMLIGSSVGELKERTNQNGAVLASEEPLKSSGLPEPSQKTKRKRDSSKEEQVSLQKESVSIITPGLPETIVAKWGEEVSVSQMMGSTKNEGKSIGYLADEWDEEYDKGKKKKIRIKEESYGGPNPFQLLATKKLKERSGTKPKWTQRMSTAKTAFRI